MALLLQYPAELLSKIAEHLVSTYPEEGCGFLAGHDDGTRRFTAFLPVENAQEQTRGRRFQIDPLVYVRAEQWADDADLQLLGIYHSHPDHPAIPSTTDLEHAFPWFSYLIIRTGEGQSHEFGSWRLDENGAFEAEQIEVIGGWCHYKSEAVANPLPVSK